MNLSGLVCGAGGFVPTINDRVKWCPPRACDWAGDGNATVKDFHPARPFWGAKPGTGADTPGPAYFIVLDNKRDVWVPVEELFPLDEQEAA